MKLSDVVVLGAAVLVVTSCAPSKASVDGCEHAVDAVRRGEPWSADERAWSTLPSCGAPGGAAARDAWTSLRSVSDSARLARVYDRVRRFRDASLFEAARALLLDSAATPEARVSSAMLVVAQLVEHARPDYHVFSTTGSHDPCAIASASDGSPRTGAPLPSNATALTESAALHVLASTSAPQKVRNAARCVYDAVARDGRVVAQVPTTTVATHLSESAGRLDIARARPANDASPRARPRRRTTLRQRVDTIRGVVGLGGGGGCVMQQPYLESRARKRVRLDGARDVLQLIGREIVVFGRATDAPHHPAYLPYPLFTVDSFVVRASDGTRVHDGILRRTPRGDVLETRDGRRLPVANLPRALEKADGMRVWIGEPLGAPASAGVIDPDFRSACAQ